VLIWLGAVGVPTDGTGLLNSVSDDFGVVPFVFLGLLVGFFSPEFLAAFFLTVLPVGDFTVLCDKVLGASSGLHNST